MPRLLLAVIAFLSLIVGATAYMSVVLVFHAKVFPVMQADGSGEPLLRTPVELVLFFLVMIISVVIPVAAGISAQPLWRFHVPFFGSLSLLLAAFLISAYYPPFYETGRIEVYFLWPFPMVAVFLTTAGLMGMSWTILRDPTIAGSAHRRL